MLLLIEIPQRGIDGKAFVLEGLLEGLCRGSVDRARTRSAEDHVDGGDGEDGNLRIGAQRKGFVVLEQDGTLASDTLGNIAIVLGQLFLGLKVVLVAFGIFLAVFVLLDTEIALIEITGNQIPVVERNGIQRDDGSDDEGNADDVYRQESFSHVAF